MPPNARAGNRGPAAADDNRRAILEAARRLFAAKGYRVPYHAIARAAGVGQGSLYRHFPNRLDLASAVFEDNFAELERLAARDATPQCFETVWRRAIEMTLESTAFVEMVVDARRALGDSRDARRFREIIREPLARARSAGLINEHMTVEDLALAQRMAYGVIVTETDPDRARDAARRALAMIDVALAVPLEPGSAPRH